MRYFKFILLACLVLSGCTAKEILVSTPVDIDVSLDKVSASKLVFSVRVSNQDAHYCYALNQMDNNEYFSGTDREIAQHHLDLEKQSFDIINKYNPQDCSFMEYACYRGDRTLKMAHIKSGTRFKLLVFQVDPVSESIVGNIISREFTTSAIEKKNLTFDFSLDGTVLSITPSSSDITYYWDFELEERIYNNFLSPDGYFYSVIDMYGDYGFIDNLLTKGKCSYDFARDVIQEGQTYILMASACSKGEIDSELTIRRFSRKGDSLYLLD